MYILFFIKIVCSHGVNITFLGIVIFKQIQVRINLSILGQNFD